MRPRRIAGPLGRRSGSRRTQCCPWVCRGPRTRRKMWPSSGLSLCTVMSCLIWLLTRPISKQSKISTSNMTGIISSSTKWLWWTTIGLIGVSRFKRSCPIVEPLQLSCLLARLTSIPSKPSGLGPKPNGGTDCCSSKILMGPFRTGWRMNSKEYARVAQEKWFRISSGAPLDLWSSTWTSMHPIHWFSCNSNSGGNVSKMKP